MHNVALQFIIMALSSDTSRKLRATSGWAVHWSLNYTAAQQRLTCAGVGGGGRGVASFGYPPLVSTRAGQPGLPTCGSLVSTQHWSKRGQKGVHWVALVSGINSVAQYVCQNLCTSKDVGTLSLGLS